jgi:hypothetical protein
MYASWMVRITLERGLVQSSGNQRGELLRALATARILAIISSAGISLTVRLLIIVAIGFLSASSGDAPGIPREFWSIHQSPRTSTGLDPPERTRNEELP